MAPSPRPSPLQFVPPPTQYTVATYLQAQRWDPRGPPTTWLELLIDYELHHQAVYVPPRGRCLLNRDEFTVEQLLTAFRQEGYRVFRSAPLPQSCLGTAYPH